VSEQQHNSSADCARELLKLSKRLSESAMKKNLVLPFEFFVSDVINEVGFRQFWLMLPGLGPNR